MNKIIYTVNAYNSIKAVNLQYFISRQYISLADSEFQRYCNICNYNIHVYAMRFPYFVYGSIEDHQSLPEGALRK